MHINKLGGMTMPSSGGSKEAPPGACPPTQNFLNSMQFFGKCWQYRRLAPPPGGLVPPPVGNPGSAPTQYKSFLTIHEGVKSCLTVYVKCKLIF